MVTDGKKSELSISLKPESRTFQRQKRGKYCPRRMCLCVEGSGPGKGRDLAVP